MRHDHRHVDGRVLVVEAPVYPYGAGGEVEDGRAQDEHQSAGRKAGEGEVGEGEVGKEEVGDGEVGEGEVGEEEVGDGEVGKGEVGKGEVGDGEAAEGEVREGEIGEGEVEAQQRRSVGGVVENRQGTANGAEEVTHGVGGDARRQENPQTRAAQEVPAASTWMGRSRSSTGRQK